MIPCAGKKRHATIINMYECSNRNFVEFALVAAEMFEDFVDHEFLT